MPFANFFSRFPRRVYDTSNNAIYRTITDIFRNVDLNELAIDSYGGYNYIRIQDGERPDVLSYRLYGSASYYWTFFIVNDILKEGINHSWPLSNTELDDFMTSEYDSYSVLEFPPIPLTDPNADTITVVGRANSFSGLILSQPYLQHLRLRSTSSPNLKARIIKYDDERLQVWVKTDGSGHVSTSGEYFTLSWENPLGDAKIETLRREYVSASWDSVFPILDPLGWSARGGQLEEMRNSGSSEEDIFQSKADFVFNNNVYRASHSWDEGRNAADGYYDSNESEISTYDALLPLVQSGFTLPKPTSYWSFYDSENKANDDKCQIKVVNEIHIEEFSNAYFSTLLQS